MFENVITLFTKAKVISMDQKEFSVESCWIYRELWFKCQLNFSLSLNIWMLKFVSSSNDWKEIWYDLWVVVHLLREIKMWPLTIGVYILIRSNKNPKESRTNSIFENKIISSHSKLLQIIIVMSKIITSITLNILLLVFN